MKSALLPCLLSVFIATTALAAPPQYSQRKDIATSFKYLNSLAVADFNGDGKPDFAIADSGTQNIRIYLDRGGGNFSDPVVTVTPDSKLGGGTVLAGDFDEDGKQDLIVSPNGLVTGTYNTYLLFFSGNGDGTLTFRSSISGVLTDLAAIAIDLNQDSHLDLITGTVPLNISYGDGHGSFTTQSFYGATPLIEGLAVGDFNGDSKMEIVSATASTTQFGAVQYLQLPSMFSQLLVRDITRIIYQPQTIAATDFNGDGKPDLLIGGSNLNPGTPSSAVILLGKGDFSFLAPINLALPNATLRGEAYTSVADFNNDKKPDVVVADVASSTLDIFLNDGTGTFPQTAPDFTTTDFPQKVGQIRTADFNADGVPDVIITNYQNNNVSIYLSQTAPTLTLTSASPSVFTGSSVIITAKTTTASGVAPTGTVTLMNGSASLGQQTLDASGQATFSLTNLSTGQHSLSATYSGDSNFTAATSAALTQSISDFQVSVPTASQTVTAGGVATYTLNVTPAGGLTGSVTVTCSQLPTLTTCDPVTVPINGQPATATLTVHTTAPVTRNNSTVHVATFGLFSIALTALLPLSRRRHLRLLATITAFTLISFAAGCSSGTSANKTPVVVTPGTPQGSAAFTITSTITLGGQTLTHTSTATLVVQ
jgi:FG-GAP repeat.